MEQQHTFDFHIDDLKDSVEITATANVNIFGKYYAGSMWQPPEEPDYEVIGVDEIEWDKDFYTDEENKVITEFINKNKKQFEKKFIESFENKWSVKDFEDDFYPDEDDFDNRDYYYQQGGELEEVLMDKIYDAEFGMYRIGDFFIIPDENENFPYHVSNREGAILYKAESLMDAVDWADSRYENGGLVKALGNVNLNKNGIVLTDDNNTITLIAYNSGNQERDPSIYNKALIYRAVKPIRQANEIIERFDNKQYEKFDESKIQSYKKNHLIIVSQNEIIYDSEAEDILGQEIVVVAKELDKDGGGRYKFRFLVYEEEADEAKKVAAALWEKSFSDLDLSVVEILTAQEWRKKYFKDGGLVSFDELAEATTETLKEAINKYQQQIDILNKIASPTVLDFAEFSGLSSQIAEIKKILRSRGETFKKGGKVKRVRFIDKVESISERLEGTKVPAKLKKDYGGRYSREEAEEAARRIAGAQLRDRKKMADGGMFPDVETFEQFKKQKNDEEESVPIYQFLDEFNKMKININKELEKYKDYAGSGNTFIGVLWDYFNNLKRALIEFEKEKLDKIQQNYDEGYERWRKRDRKLNPDRYTPHK